MEQTPRISRILFWAYLLATVIVFVAALLSPAVRAAAYAPLRDWLLPKPKPIVLTILYSTEKAAWLDDVVPRFQSTHPRVDGRPIELQMAKMGSREMYLAVLDGLEEPDLISPASFLQISILEELSRARFGQPVVRAADPASCQSVVYSPLVLVAWKERADQLWPVGAAADLWLQLHDLLTNPQGWAAHGHPEWGYVKFSHTNPLKSNSGFQTILLMTYGYLGKTAGLTAADILENPGYQHWFTDFEDTISKFGDSTGTYMEEIVAYGPSMYDMVTVYEATAIEFAASAQSRYGELQVYYPPVTSLSDHPFCVLDAPWLTPEKRRAARMFVDYLTGEEAQKLALIEHGFRPVNPAVRLEQPGSPFQSEAVPGLRSSLLPQVELPSGTVLSTLLDFWVRNVQR